ncbi:MAG: hypothetical protein K2K00_04080 [Muribaculaceae bacterium]|nr:hypothetical protein [Muribaculaceae bacterium]
MTKLALLPPRDAREGIPAPKSTKNVSERHTKSNYISRPTRLPRLTRQTRPTLHLPLLK